MIKVVIRVFFQSVVAAILLISPLMLLDQEKSLMLVPAFGSSLALMLFMPQNPAAQPSVVIGGHVLSALSAVFFIFVFDSTPIGLGAGLAAALFTMEVTKMMHPPAAANPIFLYQFVDPQATALVIIIGSVALVAVAMIWARLEGMVRMRFE